MTARTKECGSHAALQQARTNALRESRLVGAGSDPCGRKLFARPVPSL